jgi:hypothetical protein
MLLFPSPGPDVSVTVDLIKKIRNQKDTVRSSVVITGADKSGHFQSPPDTDGNTDEV